MMSSYGKTSGFSLVSSEELTLVNGGKGGGSGGGGGNKNNLEKTSSKKSPGMRFLGPKVNMPILGKVTIPQGIGFQGKNFSVNLTVGSTKTPEQVYATKEMGNPCLNLVFTLTRP